MQKNMYMQNKSAFCFYVIRRYTSCFEFILIYNINIIYYQFPKLVNFLQKKINKNLTKDLLIIIKIFFVQHLRLSFNFFLTYYVKRVNDGGQNI